MRAVMRDYKMKRVIDNPEKIKTAISFFRKRIGDLAGKTRDLEWGFPNGDRSVYPTYTIQSHLGPLQIGVPKFWDNRAPHLFRFVKDEGPPSPDVEINIPNKLDRQISGVYIAEGKSIWLCSRGSFTAYRGKIPYEIVFSHFEKWIVEVQDGERFSQVISVGSLDSPSLSNDLADFVQAVLNLKKNYKEGGKIENLPDKLWNSGEEFEGRKKHSSNRESRDYEYLHGPLCNQLKQKLETILQANTEYVVKRNKHVDAAVVEVRNRKARILFEVKTSTDLSGQLYSAIGQLFFYKHLYGINQSLLALVLPSECKKESQEVGSFLKRLGIILLFGNGGMFKTSSGKTLESIVESEIDPLQSHERC